MISICHLLTKCLQIAVLGNGKLSNYMKKQFTRYMCLGKMEFVNLAWKVGKDTV
jgi:hypothetical protein